MYFPEYSNKHKLQIRLGGKRAELEFRYSITDRR